MARWKVLIADDEFIIRDGIRSAVDWAQLDMEVVGEAEDGEEAVELALNKGIDILLIDLNMPILNGIEAMKTIKEKIECKMIVISGYDDFRYAQEAIRLQVEDYILKPVNPEKLKEILFEVKKELEVRKEQEAYLEQASNQIKKNHSQLMERFFFDWMHNRLTESEIKSQLEFLQLPGNTPKRLLLIKWSEEQINHELLSEEDRKTYLSAIENITAEILEGFEKVILQDQKKWIQVFIWDETNKDITIQIEDAVKLCINQVVYARMTTIENGDYQQLTYAYERCKNELNNYIHLTPLVRQALAYIRKHYREQDLTLESVASTLHVSAVYLSKMIKKELGQSYVHIVTQMRIKKAKELLRYSDLNIRDVAEEVGYDSQHYFSTAFKKEEGMSPKQFKTKEAQ
ncbi:two component transcriptional regulator, AraC family [Gracilibacillus ureilyticus]|uniref:Two component transcriptional regulator, AraC family n=1 Tax=Gracilibacillus ureilyticus TaxID=531814 RepID=A0A1H9NIT9_9BACI|nr:response regulator [Gracilibacillus ureilyticus]SER35303.1 two component transcriptional regulator, AraC family [Gracilibacillus ureilyticus]